MKLIIDISEEKYNEYKRIGDSRDILFEAIRNGTPLPKEYSIMLKCPNCGLDVHSDFESCPRCGENLKARKHETRLQRERR